MDKSLINNPQLSPSNERPLTQGDVFWVFVNDLLKNHFQTVEAPYLEKLKIRATIDLIFHRHYKPESIYFKLMAFVKQTPTLLPLINPIEEYYQSHFKKPSPNKHNN